MADEQFHDVHLAMRVKGAASHEEAVEAFIDQIASHGLRVWRYVVTDSSGDSQHLRDGQMITEGDSDAEPEQPATEPE